MRLFGRGRPELQVTADPTSVRPGDAVTVAVEVRGGRKDVLVHEGFVRLLMREESLEAASGVATPKPLLWTLDDPGRSKTFTATDSVENAIFYAYETFLEQSVVRGRSSARHTCTVTIPADATPTAHDVSWCVEATLICDGESDVVARAGLSVEAPDAGR